MVLCDVCGNELDELKKRCPYCGTSRDTTDIQPKGRLHKTVNLELGRPVVETAMSRLLHEVDIARRERVSLLTVIHGYGSSGKGGAIRIECRKNLDYLVSIGKIEMFVPGEEFSRKAGAVKLLLRRYPDLVQNRNLNRQNRGITLVVL